ncbi:TetR/AcrR family transcriptional regulator [Actinomadura scrupuli]|uniref:TetR/AcrR family transcriptional regulator n=1 Tax=Actinomadura scrupuli TaxID=559629 RepID=UPI003D987C41
MRTHGWRGDPPRTDDEARRRIIEATTRCVDRYGPVKTGLTDVAGELGVTRATVYRYFRNLDELLKATSLAAAGEFLDRLVAHVAGLDDAADILVEVLAFAIEQLPGDRGAGLLISSGRTASLSADLLSPTTIGFARAMLQELPVDWAAHGYSGAGLDDLAEFMLRLLHSFLPQPGGTEAAGDPRPFLRRWFVPAFAARAHTVADPVADSVSAVADPVPAVADPVPGAARS